MTALELKQDILKPEWVQNFTVIVHVDGDTWFHCHDDEEVAPNSTISLDARIGLPVGTAPFKGSVPA